MKNILLTGLPGTGKTTAIRKIIAALGIPATGFYTEEMRDRGHREGFLIRTLDGRECHLAHVGIKGSHRVGKYGVSIENIDNVAVPSIITPDPGEIIVIDEIGKMECFSERFREAVVTALDSPNIVIGTIGARGGGFIAAVKQRPDVDIIQLTPNNRDSIPDKIIRMLTDA